MPDTKNPDSLLITDEDKMDLGANPRYSSSNPPTNPMNLRGSGGYPASSSVAKEDQIRTCSK